MTDEPRPAHPAARTSEDPLWPRAAAWLGAPGGPVSSATRDSGGRADLALLGVPTHRTSLSPTGAHATPAAVRAALARYSTWSSAHGIDLAEHVRAVDLGDVTDPDGDPAGAATVVAEAAAAARLLVLLGGDNSLTYAAALGVAGPRLAEAGLVTLDAHHDLRDGVSNGSPVRRLLEAGLPGHRVVQVGIADWTNSAAYARRAAEHGVHVVPRRRVAERGIDAVMAQALSLAGAGGGPVYVDLDVDVCDRSVAPGCPASAPGGLSADELLRAAHLTGADPRVAAVDLTEVDATADAPDGRTVRLVALAVLELACGLALRGAAPG